MTQKYSITRYVAADAGTEFKVSLIITSEYMFDSPTLGFDVFVDGVKLASKCCLQSKRGCLTDRKLVVEGVEMGELDTGRGDVRPFTFNKMGEGEITVEVHRRGEGELVQMGYVAEPEDIPHEFGRSCPMLEPVTFWYAPLLDSEPLGVFRFLYRPKGK